MRDDSLETRSVAEIMAMSPAIVRLFIERHLHCIGCPIAPFHTLDDAAVEHGVMADDLIAAVVTAVNAELKDGRA